MQSLHWYVVTVCHDDGTARIYIGPCRSAAEARRMIMNAERCPDCAILRVSEDLRGRTP